jgi:hypothetical protein
LHIVSQPELSVENDILSFQIECIQAQQPLVFELTFPTMFQVKNPLIKKDSVGIFNLTFDKIEYKIWAELIKEEELRKKLKPKIWY